MRISQLLCASLLFITSLLVGQPKLTMIIVVDQLAHHELQKIETHVRGGLKYLLTNGVRYENAYFPHSVPETATGHAGLNTGTLSATHGIIGNQWRDEHGKVVRSDDDKTGQAAVFSPTGLYNFGKSSTNMLVDGISDQFVLASKKHTPHHTVAVSLKSHAAINAAGKLGKAIWFDEQSGNFTSSKAYFDQLPEWLNTFNNMHHPHRIKQYLWKQVRRKKSRAYKFAYCTDYESCAHESLINHPFDITQDAFYKTFKMTPFANQIVLDVAYACIDEYLLKHKENNLLLWVSLSALDYLGHHFGPDSLEVIDMLYHLDLQLNKFLKRVFKKVGKDNVLIALTSDHGVAPMPELMQKRGYKNAHRIDADATMHAMNQIVKQEFGITNLIQNFEPTQFYFNQLVWQSIQPKTKHTIMHTLKTFLTQQPGIKQAWTSHELDTAIFRLDQLEYFIQKQRYPGRSGQLLYLCQPYSFITKYPKGTSHDSPYGYNTHVPLIIYQENKFERKSISKKVWALQLPNTLAQILNIAHPSASTFNLLPLVLQK